MLNMLVQLTEKDKRLLVALCIIFIVLFVIIAYIANGIKAIMRKYGKGIDTYMHDLCKEGLVTTPSEFRKQVFVRETKTLYLESRWAIRIGIVVTAILLLYAFIAKPSGDNTFAFYGEAIKDLALGLEWPKAEFFGIKNFPIDWPSVSKVPSPKFTLSSIITYASLLAYIYLGFKLFLRTLCFIGRLNRARVKSSEVFKKSLDNFSVDGVNDDSK